MSFPLASSTLEGSSPSFKAHRGLPQHPEDHEFQDMVWQSVKDRLEEHKFQDMVLQHINDNLSRHGQKHSQEPLEDWDWTALLTGDPVFTESFVYAGPPPHLISRLELAMMADMTNLTSSPSLQPLHSEPLSRPRSDIAADRTQSPESDGGNGTKNHRRMVPADSWWPHFVSETEIPQCHVGDVLSSLDQRASPPPPSTPDTLICDSIRMQEKEGEPPYTARFSGVENGRDGSEMRKFAPPTSLGEYVCPVKCCQEGGKTWGTPEHRDCDLEAACVGGGPCPKTNKSRGRRWFGSLRRFLAKVGRWFKAGASADDCEVTVGYSGWKPEGEVLYLERIGRSAH